MRLFAALCFGLCLGASPTLASTQDGEREARLAMAERAFDALQADQMAAQMTTIMQAMPQSELRDMPARERAAIEDTMADVMETMMARMFEGMIEVYADTYTMEELTALATFYESPIGQSIMHKSNQMTPQVIALMNEIMPDTMRQMANGVCDRLDCTADERRQLIQMMMAQLGMVES